MIKKTSLILLICLCSSYICGQEKRKWRGNFLVTASIKNKETGTATLTYVENTRKGSENKVIEAAIAEGKFAFSDYIEEPTIATLSIDTCTYEFYIDPTQMQISVLDEETIEVANSWSNEDRNKIRLLNDKINQLATKDSNQQNDNLPELSYASIVKDSFVVLQKMLTMATSKNVKTSDTTTKQMIAILMKMSDELKDTPTGVRTSEALFLASVAIYSREQE